MAKFLVTIRRTITYEQKYFDVEAEDWEAAEAQAKSEARELDQMQWDLNDDEIEVTDCEEEE